MRMVYCSTYGLRSFLAVSAPLLRNTNPSAPTKQCRLDDFFGRLFCFWDVTTFFAAGLDALVVFEGVCLDASISIALKSNAATQYAATATTHQRWVVDERVSNVGGVEPI